MLLSSVDVVFFVLEIIYDIPPYTNCCLLTLFSKQFLLVVIPGTPSVDKPFLIYFLSILLVVLWVAVSGIPPFSNLFLLIFSF